MSIIIDAVAEGTPARKPRPELSSGQNSRLSQTLVPRTCSPWWTSECDKLIRLRKAARKSFKFNPTQENFIRIRQIEAQVKSFLRRTKKEYFLSFCSTLSKYSDLKFVWQRIKGMSNKFHRKENSNEYNCKRLIRR